MSTATTQNFHDQFPMASPQRGSAALANATALLSLNKALTAAGSATATTTTKAKTVNTLTYTIGGSFFSKGATDNFWTLAGAVVAAASFQKYLLLIDSAGAATVQEGVQSTLAAASVTFTNVNAVSTWGALMTTLNAGKVVVSVLTIATDATHTFTPGTTALSATGITATFVDGIDPTLLPLIANAAGSVFGNV